jgi:uncharacterized protein
MSGEKATRDAKYWIEKLQLIAHPEGGYFRQTYVSDAVIAHQALPAGFGGARPASTAIYFLLDGENFSAFHRLRSDEMWHFYAGFSLIVHLIGPHGNYSSILLGNDADRGEVFQAVVKAEYWFASEIAQNFHPPARSAGRVGQPQPLWALVGCTVAPGFDFADFDLAKREELIRQFPQHRPLIERLTRG